ncbi:MAG: dephospho-CoA kinase [Desulfarculaceae bacterium]|nr:dephospho-CoA kinase [Desulfarculaceae bacterium]MCF8047586.1 dephospho-CoA kinase [Desulfarculaceae bacterium]MCF8064817.1 dephospho-CoA kinase [Desulfarculaceae bacterium]MCF8123407.1 dephospho-CoA kinase [Desulfarculaceae bacterium]
MLKVGLTGGIASGKSTVDRMLVKMGAHLVDTDQLARQVVEPGSPALAAISAAFGPNMIAADGNLDRARMRAKAFGDAQARAKLNAILHPRINQLVDAELARLAARAPQGVAIVDVPLLFETGGEKRFDCTVLVYVPHQVQMDRLMARDHCGPQTAQEALDAQMPLENKKKKADFLVDNSGGLDETLRQVQRLWQDLLDKARST